MLQIAEALGCQEQAKPGGAMPAELLRFISYLSGSGPDSDPVLSQHHNAPSSQRRTFAARSLSADRRDRPCWPLPQRHAAAPPRQMASHFLVQPLSQALRNGRTTAGDRELRVHGGQKSG